MKRWQKLDRLALLVPLVLFLFLSIGKEGQAALGNRSEGAEFCGNDCGAASPGSGRCLGFSADCTYMAGRQPYHEKAANSKCHLSGR